MTEVVMPRLSDSMEEGTIIKWLKAPGETVRRGEALVEIETDKANMTYEADADGVLELLADEGDTLPIGQVIARLHGEGDASASSETREVVLEGAVSESPSPSSAPATPSAVAESHQRTGERVRASPVARRVARELGVDLGQVHGSGPGGRIVKADVATAPVGPSLDPPTAKGHLTVQELTRTQQTIARRMAESKATVPDFTLTTEVDMQAAADLRGQLRSLDRDVLPSYNDMVVRACGLALREHPRANGSYRDAHFELHSRVNVGVAVAAGDSLVVPTIFDADAKALETIAQESRALAGRVRAGTITPPELSGATFTVSNLGMYGVDSFTAVIVAPQAAILAVGAVSPRAVIRDATVVAHETMSITLACDHRILYGAPAAEFLHRVRELLEQPLALVLAEGSPVRAQARD